MPCHFFRYRAEVRQKRVLLPERHEVGFCPCEDRTHLVDGVGGLWNEGKIPGVEKRERKMGSTFFGTDKRQYLAVGVELDPEPALEPARGGLPEHSEAKVGWIAVVLRVAALGYKRFDDGFGSRYIRVTDPEADDVDSGRFLLRDLSVHLNEEVWWYPLEPS